MSSLKALTINLFGIPSILGGNAPKKRLEYIINNIITKFDLIFLQEDFFFHSKLEESLSDEYEIIYNKSWRSGLCTLVRRSKIFVEEAKEVAFSDCSGIIGKGFDCWVTKGFQNVKLRTKGEGHSFRVFNTHLDSSNKEYSKKIREKQLNELSTALKLSKNERVMLAGDLNTFTPFLKFFVSSNSLKFSAASSKNSLDYVLYKGNFKVKTLRTRSYFKGGPVSDHPLLKTTITFDKKKKRKKMKKSRK